MSKPIRRVVTGQSATGQAVITADGPAPIRHAFEDGLTLTEIWKTTESPAQLRTDAEEPGAGALSLYPPKGGSVFRIADIPPEGPQPSTSAARAVFEKMGAAHASTSVGSLENAMMHRTHTIDFAIVLDGTITLVVDTGEVSLKPGDVVIQRGANHAWSNRSGKNCRIAFVMLDALYPTE
jgi:mannose-6-phosphate isomerase-like protein (cupin superfamily)